MHRSYLRPLLLGPFPTSGGPSYLCRRALVHRSRHLMLLSLRIGSRLLSVVLRAWRAAVVTLLLLEERVDAMEEASLLGKRGHQRYEGPPEVGGATRGMRGHQRSEGPPEIDACADESGAPAARRANLSAVSSLLADLPRLRSGGAAA